MPERRMPPGAEGRVGSSLAVTAGLLGISLISAGQALLIAFLTDSGPETDAFFAAYAVYVPLATFGFALRGGIVPLLGGEDRRESLDERGGEIVGRAWLLGATAAGLLILLAWPLSMLITNEHDGDSAQGTALLTLAILAPAASLQVLAGASSAVLAVRRRFRVSMAIYLASGLLALGISAALLSPIGIAGAAVGLAAGALALAVAHVVYIGRLGIRVRLRPGWALDREQGGLAWALVGGVALGASLQVGFAIACANISAGPGAVTQYAYGYFVVGLLLNLSVVPLAIVTLPDLVDDVRAKLPEADSRYLTTLAPYVFLVLVPALTAFVCFGEPVLIEVFDSALGTEGAETMYDVAVRLTPGMLAAALFTLGGTVVVSQSRWRLSLQICAASILIYGALLTIFGGDPERVAVGHVLGAVCSAALVLGAVLGRRAPAVMAGLLRGVLPAVILSASIVAVRLLVEDPTAGEALAGAAAGLALYVGLAALLWRSVTGTFLMMFRRWAASRA